MGGISNGLTFKIMHINLQNEYGYWDSVQILRLQYCIKNWLIIRIIDGEINEKHVVIVSWLGSGLG